MGDKTTTPSENEETAAQATTEETNSSEGAETKTDDSKPETTESGSAEEQSTTEKETEETSSSDDDLETWAKEKNLPLDDPLALAKMYRESEKKMHQTGAEAAELRKRVGKQAEESAEQGEDQEVTDTRKLLTQLAVTDFYLNNPEARKYDDKMAEILTDKPYLVNDLDTLYIIAKAKTSDEELLAARKSGEKNALSSANKSQRQGSPSMAATNKGTSEKEDPIMAGLSADD